MSCLKSKNLRMKAPLVTFQADKRGRTFCQFRTSLAVIFL